MVVLLDQKIANIVNLESNYMFMYQPNKYQIKCSDLNQAILVIKLQYRYPI